MLNIDLPKLYQRVYYKQCDRLFGLTYSNTKKHPLYSTNNFFKSSTLTSKTIIDPLKLLIDRRLCYYANPYVNC
jgi:hypothetical protein